MKDRFFNEKLVESKFVIIESNRRAESKRCPINLPAIYFPCMRVSSIWLTHPSNERKEEGGIGRAREQGERPNSSVNIASSVNRRLHVNELASTIGQKSRTSLLLASHREKSSFSRKFVARFLSCQRNALSTIRIPNVYLPFDHVTNKHTNKRDASSISLPFVASQA